MCLPGLLECVNKEFVWEFERSFVFFSKGKDLNLARKLFSIKFGLYIPFPSVSPGGSVVLKHAFEGQLPFLLLPA